MKFKTCSNNTDDLFNQNWKLEKIPTFESDQVSITTDTKVPMLTPEEPDMSWHETDFFKEKNDDNTSEPSPIN